MRTVDDERTPLVPARASSSRDIARHRVVLGVLAVVTGVFVLSIRDDRGGVARALGRWHGVRGRLLPRVPRSSERAGALSRTFTMYDHCLSDATREEGFARDFWTSPRASGKIVRHNYGSKKFFEYDDGIEL